MLVDAGEPLVRGEPRESQWPENFKDAFQFCFNSPPCRHTKVSELPLFECLVHTEGIVCAFKNEFFTQMRQDCLVMTLGVAWMMMSIFHNKNFWLTSASLVLQQLSEPPSSHSNLTHNQQAWQNRLNRQLQMMKQ
jgi:hypothetical protein